MIRVSRHNMGVVRGRLPQTFWEPGRAGQVLGRGVWGEGGV